MRLSTLLPLLGLLALGYAKKCPRQRTSPGKEVLCYTFSNDAAELLDSICKCTTLVHQGHQLQNLSTAGVEELQKTLKDVNPALQVVVSVTDPQGTLKTSGTTRQEASGRLANLLSQVDGVELDMSAGSKERLTHFVKGVKDEMIRKSTEKRIILALPTKAEDLAKQYDLKALAKYVDLFTLSTHYLVDNSEAFNTFHPSRLMGIFDMLNTDSLVDLVSGMGVPKKKLLVSLPASAYKFTLKDEEKNVPGSSVMDEEPTAISQKELCDMMSAGEWTVERDTDLTAPYAFKDSTWIAYEDKTSVGIKGKYVLLRELAGLGVHDIENDLKNDCSKPVTYEVYRSFTDMKRKTRGAVLASLENDLHHVDIPQSKHVRSSGFRIVRVVDTAGAIHAIRENTQTEFTCTRQGYFVHPKSCNRFYRCVKFNQGIDDYSVFEFDCPAGLAFDERTEVCVWPGSLTEGSPCPGSSEIAPVPRARFQCPKSNGYYADPQNCRWFFACFDLGEPELTAYEFRCPFGLVFDEQKLICEWPWLVPGCGASGSGYSRTEYGGSQFGGKIQGHGAGLGLEYGAGSGSGHGGSSGSGHGAGLGLGYGAGSGSGHGGSSGSGHGAGLGLGYGAGSGSGHGGSSGSGHGAVLGSGHGAGVGLGHGAGEGSGHGSIGEGIGYGDYSGSGIGGGVPGQYGSGAEGSAYPGSKASESRQTEMEANKYSGTGNNAANYQGHGHGAGGSSYFGAGTGGSGHSGSGGEQSTYYSGANGDFSGSGAVNGGQSGSGAGIYGKGVGSTVSGSYSGAGTIGAGHLDAGVSNTQHSGIGSGGLQYVNQGAGFSGTGHFGGGEFGLKYPTSTGSGSSGSVYSGQTVSTVGYNGAGKTGVGSGLSVNAAGNSGFNAFGNTATNFKGFGQTSQTIGQDGLAVSLQTGGSHGASTGVTGSGQTSHSGYFTGNHGDGSEFSSSGSRTDYYGQGNGGYTSSDSQDVINGGSYSGSDVVIGTDHLSEVTTGNAYTGTGGSKGGYYSSVTKNTLSSANPALNVFGYKKPGTAAPGIFVQNVTPGYSVTGSGINHGLVYGGSATGAEHANDGILVTGSGYDIGNTGSGNVIVDHESDYHGGYVSSTPSAVPGLNLVNTGSGNKGGSVYVETGSSSSVSNIGKGGVSTGTSTYHGNGGTSNSFLSSKTNSNTNVNIGGHDAYVTSNADSGTVSSHGGSSGTITYGNVGQGYGGTSRPEYVSINPVTPGYVSHEVTHTGYNDGAPGVVVTGTAAPGVILHGTSGPGSYSGEQVYSGVGHESSHGSVVGVTGTVTYHGNTGSSAYVTPAVNTADVYSGKVESEFAGVTGSGFGIKTTHVGSGASIHDKDAGYKTTEYHDNGGRGTVTYNNGFSASKYTESDIRDRPAYASLPDSIVSGGRIDGSNGVVLGNSLAGINPFTSPGFTKTGTTKTGITTAQIGGSGSYVTSTGYGRPTSSPASGNIGSSAFKGQSSDEGYSYGSSISHDVNNLAYVTSTVSPDLSYVDTSKINLGQTSSVESSSGYTYKKPIVPFVTGSNTASTPSPLPVTYHGSVVPLTVTTPSSHLNVELYNVPTVVTSAPITAAPAVVNTYSYKKPEVSSISTASAGYKYGTSIQSGIYQGPNIGEKQYTVTSTPAPIAYATGPAEVYKSTLFEAARQPITVSTVAPVFDTGYKTVVSSTAAPIAVTTGQYYYTDSRFKTGSVSNSQTSGGNQQPEIIFQNQYVSSTSAPNTKGGYVYEKPRIQLNYDSSSTVTPSVTVYQRPAVTVKQQAQYTPSSTIAPNFNGPYDKSSASIRPAFGQQTPQRGYNTASTATTASNSQGYVYPKPSIKFVTPAAVPVITESHRYEGSNRGGVKYTPTVYVDDNARYTDTENGFFGNKITGSKVVTNSYVSSTSVPAYQVTTPSSIHTNSYGSYNSGPGEYTVSDGDSSSSFRPGGYTSTKSSAYQSTTPSSIHTNSYGSYNSGPGEYTVSDGDSSSSFRPGGCSSTVSSAYQFTTPSSIHTNSYGSYNSGPGEYTTSNGDSSSSFRPGGYSSTSLYEVSTVKPTGGRGKGKVIVKLSDLHPLLLKKVGAQCTCRSDPFETLRGPGSKLIKSSKGDLVDLAQYDESQIYVDLEADREPSQSAAVYRTPNGSPTPSPPAYSSLRTPVTAVFGLTTPAPPVFRSRGRPSTAYLPVSSSPSPINRYRGGSSRSKVIPLESGAYETASDNLDPSYVSRPGVSITAEIPVGRSAGVKAKTGKSLGGFNAAGNAIGGAGAAFDRYGPGGWRDVDETLQGGADCARPGLFRHPKFCNKFYACHWDEWKQKHTLHVFNCPVQLSFDSNSGACNWPSKGPACQDDNLLV